MKRCLSDRQVIEISLERLVGKTSDLFGVDWECVRVDRRLRSWSGIDLGVTTWVVTSLESDSNALEGLGGTWSSGVWLA